MSIRLRLTLLYSAILTLTLIVFGVVLYSIQARGTLSALKQDLLLSSGRFSEAALRLDETSAWRAPPPPEPRRPQSFDEFSVGRVFEGLREREIMRILDADGTLVVSPFGREEDALPLSAEGLAALQSQQDWWQSDTVAGASMLIYSRPIVQNGETAAIVQVARPLTERNRSLRSLATTLSVAGVFTTLVAFGAGWGLAGLTLRPIDRIAHTAQSIGDERDFTHRVDYTGPPDEVGRLASTFNQMLARLQDAYEKVEHSLQMQRDFLADVSHELRTPLTTLRGNVGLLREPPAPPEEQTDILSDMEQESDRLIRLVNDLLVLARADAGRGLAKEPLRIQPVLEETLRQAHLLDPGREIHLAGAAGSSIVGDRDAFKQVMLILLDNALKHSDGDIEVEARRKGEQVVIQVQDHGPGIAPDKLERVFDRFTRGDEGLHTPGLGLGLPIAKTLVESMGGTITLDSKMGEGSTVVMCFAAAPQQEAGVALNGR